MIAVVIETTIATTSDVTNTALRSILSVHGKDYAMTDNLIQQARTYAKNQFLEMRRRMLGMQEFVQSMKDMEHIVKLNMTDTATTMKRLTKVVLDTEKKRKKDEDNVTTFFAQECVTFMNKWKAQNYEKLVFELGTSVNNYEFLKCIMSVMSASKITVPLLQNIIQHRLHELWEVYPVFCIQKHS